MGSNVEYRWRRRLACRWQVESKARGYTLCVQCREPLPARDVLQGHDRCRFCRDLNRRLADRQRDEQEWAREHLSDDHRCRD